MLENVSGGFPFFQTLLTADISFAASKQRRIFTANFLLSAWDIQWMISSRMSRRVRRKARFCPVGMLEVALLSQIFLLVAFRYRCRHGELYLEVRFGLGPL